MSKICAIGGVRICDGAVWAKIAAATPAQIAAAWARQALATLPAIPTLDMPDDLFIRVERTREDIENLLTVLAAEMDAEGGA